MTENQSACQPLHHSRYKVLAQKTREFQQPKGSTVPSVPLPWNFWGTAALHFDDPPEGRHLRTDQNLGLAVFFSGGFLSWQPGCFFRDGFLCKQKPPVATNKGWNLMCDLGHFWRFAWLMEYMDSCQRSGKPHSAVDSCLQLVRI